MGAEKVRSKPQIRRESGSWLPTRISPSGDACRPRRRESDRDRPRPRGPRRRDPSPTQVPADSPELVYTPQSLVGDGAQVVLLRSRHYLSDGEQRGQSGTDPGASTPGAGRRGQKKNDLGDQAPTPEADDGELTTSDELVGALEVGSTHVVHGPCPPPGRGSRHGHAVPSFVDGGRFVDRERSLRGRLLRGPFGRFHDDEREQLDHFGSVVGRTLGRRRQYGYGRG